MRRSIPWSMILIASVVSASPQRPRAPVDAPEARVQAQIPSRVDGYTLEFLCSVCRLSPWQVDHVRARFDEYRLTRDVWFGSALRDLDTMQASGPFALHGQDDLEAARRNVAWGRRCEKVSDELLVRDAIYLSEVESILASEQLDDLQTVRLWQQRRAERAVPFTRGMPGAEFEARAELAQIRLARGASEAARFSWPDDPALERVLRDFEHAWTMALHDMLKAIRNHALEEPIFGASLIIEEQAARAQGDEAQADQIREEHRSKCLSGLRPFADAAEKARVLVEQCLDDVMPLLSAEEYDALRARFNQVAYPDLARLPLVTPWTDRTTATLRALGTESSSIEEWSQLNASIRADVESLRRLRIEWGRHVLSMSGYLFDPLAGYQQQARTLMNRVLGRAGQLQEAIIPRLEGARDACPAEELRDWHRWKTATDSATARQKAQPGSNWPGPHDGVGGWLQPGYP